MNKHPSISTLLILLVLSLTIAACSTLRTPTPKITPYGKPFLAVDITRPIYHTVCTPTPSGAEKAGVEALALPDKIDFELQRAIYSSQEQGIPWRPAVISIGYDPNLQTITETVVLAEGHGVRITHRFVRAHHIYGEAPLDIIPQLAAEPGVSYVELSGLYYVSPHSCPTPGGPTPVPVTPIRGQGP